jgi:hypothetical protein
MEAAKPSLQVLIENRCLSAHDILYNIRGVQELVSWKIPEPLARSLYDVIEELHRQSNYVSKRSLKRELRVSIDFEKFLAAKQQETTQEKQRKAATAHQIATVEVIPERKAVRKKTEYDAVPEHKAVRTKPERDAVPEQRDTSDAYEAVKQRLEKDVLQLPIDSDSLDASDVIFKAAFLTCCCSATALPSASDSESYDDFLRTLVQLQSTAKTDEIKAIVRERVVVAKQIADRYVRRCEELDIATAGDMVVHQFKTYSCRCGLSVLTRLLLSPRSELPSSAFTLMNS